MLCKEKREKHLHCGLSWWPEAIIGRILPRASGHRDPQVPNELPGCQSFQPLIPGITGSTEREGFGVRQTPPVVSWSVLCLRQPGSHDIPRANTFSLDVFLTSNLQYISSKECRGSTRRRCAVCRGRSRGARRPCKECQGEMVVPCTSCMALGRVCCEMCVGKGQLRYFTELRVDYRRHVQSCVLGSCVGVPEERLGGAAGEVLHTAVGRRVRPIATFHAEPVNAASRRMVNASHSSWPDGRVVQQKHALRAVPVSRVQYLWRDTAGSLFIYGVDRSVYWPQHPQRRRLLLCCPWLQDC